MVRLAQRSLSSQLLVNTNNLTSNNQETEYIQTQADVNTKVALINHNIHTRKTMLTERTERTWFSCFLQHSARRWSGSILTTPEPAWRIHIGIMAYKQWVIIK